MEVSVPSQACLTRETSGSDPLFLEPHQLICERHPTPFAVSPGQQIDKIVDTLHFLFFGRDISENYAIFSDEASIDIWKSLSYLFVRK